MPELMDCSECGGSCVVVVGEHYVTADMASDAGDPSMTGAFYGYEFGPCDRCDGAGRVHVDREEAK